MEFAFARVEKMLMGKKYFPQNVRALRIVVEEILRPYMLELYNLKDLHSLLDGISNLSKTAKAWVENLIKPVLYIMLFIRDERE